MLMFVLDVFERILSRLETTAVVVDELLFFFLILLMLCFVFISKRNKGSNLAHLMMNPVLAHSSSMPEIDPAMLKGGGGGSTIAMGTSVGTTSMKNLSLMLPSQQQQQQTQQQPQQPQPSSGSSISTKSTKYAANSPRNPSLLKRSATETATSASSHSSHSSHSHSSHSSHSESVQLPSHRKTSNPTPSSVAVTSPSSGKYSFFLSLFLGVLSSTVESLLNY